MKCFYHNDLDGKCAGAIVYRASKRGCQLIEMDYKDEVPIDMISNNEPIVIVDFSFKPDVMKKVLKITDNVVWIDHHKTAFDYDYNKILEGLRDDKFSGCELAWKYFNPNSEMPLAVMLIGDRDKWAWKFGHDTLVFNLGLEVCQTKPDSKEWDLLFNSIEECKKVSSNGEICLAFRNNLCRNYRNNYGFEVAFEGYDCYALGLHMFGSEAFAELTSKYDMCISFVYSDRQWTVSLYSKTIDVSEIAKKYGGGGHKGASGFVTKKLPF